MTENNISLKPISELLKYGFFIPSYQRGYRWSKQQVEDLLLDIWEFSKKDKSKQEFYCLQPVVVKECTTVTKNKFNLDSSKIWYEVVDGQQRLTTIHILLTFFDNLLQILQKEKYLIKYQTRHDSASFLNKINIENKEENIDYFFICEAYETIREWFQNNPLINKIDFLNTLLREDDNNNGNNNVRVIWYKTGDINSIEIFTRINMGKIPLTNAELIKALFLRISNLKNADPEKIKLNQLEIASEWDYMEFALQNDAFWYFLNKNENLLATRIEFIFDLIAEKAEQADDYYTFRHFNELFKNNSEHEINAIWKKIKNCFQTLDEWFSDRELYHKIGFLITTGTALNSLIFLKEGKSKTAFKISLSSKIKEKVKIDWTELEYRNGTIRNVLLLHNIQSMLNNKDETNRFPFDRFKKEKWDVEHIHAKATEVKVEKKNQKEWLINNYIPNDQNSYQNHQIEKIISTGVSIDDKDFSVLIEFVLGKEDDNIRNLCLLDRGTNRSYKNAGFKEKRRQIIKREVEGTFIPLCTKNVFMKYYSSEVKDIEIWNENDRESYSSQIMEVITQYLPHVEAENEH